MGYDPRAESRRLLTEGLPDRLPPRLSRRVRFAPLSFDVAGPYAVTTFVRRGVNGAPQLENWCFAQRDGEWQLLGGGGGSSYDNPLAPAPPAAWLGTHLTTDGAGSTTIGHGRLPWTERYLYYATLRLAAEVGHVVVGDRRLDPPPHGRQVVVWVARRPPMVETFTADGAPLGSHDIHRPRTMPLRYVD